MIKGVTPSIYDSRYNLNININRPIKKNCQFNSNPKLLTSKTGSLFTYDFGGGIQVTGSHNPSDMNGFKICLGKQTLSGAQIQDLKERMLKLQNQVHS